jgi:tetratricopeptide (TPR) repeat protein
MTTALRERPADLPPRAELQSVPFHPQEDHQCGPAALATVMQAAGVSITPASLSGEVYLPSRQGSLQIELLASLRRHGLLAYRLEPSLHELLAEVSAGSPVLVLQNLGLAAYPVWHYAVVIGYDLPAEKIGLRSGREAHQVLSFQTFERTWARSGHWAVLALPPGRLPARVKRENYLRAVVDLELSQRHEQARQAYQAALMRWPDDPVAHMGLANSAYRLGDLATAASHFQLAADNDPGGWQALNNLALVLSELGRHDEAWQVASQARVRSANQGSAALTQVEATLASIRQRLPAAER